MSKTIGKVLSVLTILLISFCGLSFMLLLLAWPPIGEILFVIIILFGLYAFKSNKRKEGTTND